MEVAVRSLYPIDLTAEDVLRKEGRDGALAEGRIVLRPFASKPGRAGIFAPKLFQRVIKLPWIPDPVKIVIDRGNRRVLPAVKIIFFHNLCIVMSPGDGVNGSFWGPRGRSQCHLDSEN